MATSSAYKDITFLLEGPPGATGGPGATGATGPRGPVLRGPRDWASLANGTAFYAGGDNDTYLDVVLYNNQYYVCKKSHTKMPSYAPGSSRAEINGLWQLGDKIDLVATNILLANYSLIKNLGVEAIEMKDANGNVLFEAKDGNVTCKTGTFNNIDVQSGKVGGLTIAGNGLTNDAFDDDSYLVFRNDAQGSFVGVGGNVLPASTATRAVARFENGTPVNTNGTNYAIMAHARGARTNIALALDGGAVQGFAMRNKIVGATATAGAISREDYNVVTLNSSQCVLTLPQMQLYDDGHVIRIKRLGNGALGVRMRACYTYNGTSARQSLPILITATGGYVAGANTHTLGSAVGDAVELVWCRDIVVTYNGATYYGAWIEYKLS